MKKYLKTILIIAVLVIFLIGVKVILSKPKYTLDNVIELGTPEITNNMYIKETIIPAVEDDNNFKTSFEIYVKDNMVYEKFIKQDAELLQEYLFDIENQKEIIIDYSTKELSSFELDEKSVEEIIQFSDNSEYSILKEDSIKNTYKYLGEENCIKFSIMTSDNRFVGMEEKVKIIYYFNIDDKRIEKLEYYNVYENKEELYSTVEYEYSYDTITNNDILKFDISNYSGFTIINN